MSLKTTGKRLDYWNQLKNYRAQGEEQFTRMDQAIQNIANVVTAVTNDADMSQDDIDDAQAFYDDIKAQLQSYVNGL